MSKSALSLPVKNIPIAHDMCMTDRLSWANSWHLDIFYEFKVTWAYKDKKVADLQVKENNDGVVEVVYLVYRKVRGKFVGNVYSVY